MTERLEEHVVDGKRLGRHVAHDPRSKEFRADAAKKIVSVTHKAWGLPLDQGNVGSCTAEALLGALNSTPNFDGQVRAPYDQAAALRLYELETKLEGQPYPEYDPGGTGLMVCKAAKELGLISNYKHAFGVQHALQALVLRPVITGVPWYDSFDSPSRSGLVKISPDAQVRGGHEFVVDQIELRGKKVGCWNSWGASYGVGGRFYMTWATWDRLLSEQGDVTVPIL